MSIIQKKQINAYLNGYILISGVNVSGSSFNATTAISTACATAGDNGVAVPFVQYVSQASGPGVLTDSTRLQIFGANSKAILQDANGNEIYGKLTYATNVFTLSFYSTNAGSESAYSFSAGTSISFSFIYVYSFQYFPSNALTNVGVVNLDTTTQQVPITIRELITVASTNTITQQLSYTPLYGVDFIVNSVDYPTVSSAPLFSVSGRAITVNPTNVSSSFALNTTDEVIARYEHT
jgi:hypothetical protein